MDGARFDRVTRGLAGASTRRGVLRGVVAGLLGGAALAEGADAATRRRTVCRPLASPCTRAGQCCSGLCERTSRGSVRSPRYQCACEAGLVACGRTCHDLRTDATSCGACGVVCESGECVDGACLEVTAQCDFGLADGAACVNAIDCCSLNCSGGTCAAPGVDCSTYDGSYGLFCYRVLGETLGVAPADADLVCGTTYSSRSYVNEICASNADCQTYVTTDGAPNVVALCIDQGYLCFGNCKNLVATPQCLFLYTEGATC